MKIVINMTVYFVCSKKNHTQVTVYDGVKYTVYDDLDIKNKRDRLASFMNNMNVNDVIVSFNYTLKFLRVIGTRCKYIVLKDMYRDTMKNETFSRKDMCDKVGIDIDVYEPRYPKATGVETVTLYEKLYNVMK